MSKTSYELELNGDETIIAFLSPYIPEDFDFRREANTKRRAIGELFGGAVQVDIVSVRRIPAKTRRRVLKV